MVSVLDSQPGQQEPEDYGSATESEVNPVTDESEDEHEPKDEQGSRDDSQESGRGAGGLEWVTNTNKAPLRRAMGITADMDSKTQNVESRDKRQEVRRLAGTDYFKT